MNRVQLVTRQPLVGSFAASLLLLLACAVDERHLQGVQQTSDVGAPGCGDIPDCTSADSADSGVQGSLGQLCTGICPDLNHNDELDTSETLVDNPSFSVDISGWVPDMGIGLGWNRNDACGRCDSGSIAVTNQFAGTSGDIAVGGARVCIPVEASQSYEAMARVKPDPESFGGIGLEFYESTDCTGNRLNAFNSPLVSTAFVWQRASTPGIASALAHSASVRLTVGASVAPKAGFANVFFDNILVVGQGNQ